MSRVSAKAGIKAREALFGRRFSERGLQLVMETDTIAPQGG